MREKECSLVEVIAVSKIYIGSVNIYFVSEGQVTPTTDCCM
jgi:hypothetical protein